MHFIDSWCVFDRGLMGYARQNVGKTAAVVGFNLAVALRCSTGRGDSNSLAL